MRKAKRLIISAATIVAAAGVTAAQAAIDEELLKILLQNGAITQQQYDQLKSPAETTPAEPARSEEIKAAVKENLPSWVERFTPHADFRLREDWQEFDKASDPGKVDRNRQRIRARFGFTYDVNDYTQLGVQLATGADDPISTNQSLEDRFSSKAVVLDLAYVKQGFMNGRGTFWGGKFKNPYANTSFITFDPDLRFEGVAAQFDTGNGLFGTIGAYPLDELGGETADPWLFGAQGGYEFKVRDSADATVAVAYYHYTDVAGIDDDGPSGNTESEFQIVNPNLMVHINTLPVYVGLQGDLLFNTEADTADMGYLLGLKVGHKKIKKFRDWQLFGTYSRLEGNAQFDEFSDSDFRSGGTNNKGFTIGYKLGLGKGWEHDLKYYNAREIAGVKDEEQRVQADLKYQF